MIRIGFLLGISVLVFQAGSIPAAEPDSPKNFKPGEKDNFIGAEGTSFRMTSRVSQTEVNVDDPLTLTIRISAAGKWQTPPRRPDLKALERFKNGDFHIERATSSKADREYPKENAWEFDFKLRPRDEAVQKIPPLLFTYYNPEVLFEDKRWIPMSAPGIPINVKPRSRVRPREIEGGKPLRPPERFFQVTEGSEVLRRQSSFTLSWGLAMVLILAPPALCMGGYFIWSKLYPDAANQARRRRSRAARRALRSLRSYSGKKAEDAVAMGQVLVNYLRERFELTAADPTHAEVAAFLHHLGCPDPLIGRTARYFQECDAIRFAGNENPSMNGLASEAESLIHDLEAQPWSASS